MCTPPPGSNSGQSASVGPLGRFRWHIRGMLVRCGRGWRSAVAGPGAALSFGQRTPSDEAKLSQSHSPTGAYGCRRRLGGARPVVIAAGNVTPPAPKANAPSSSASTVVVWAPLRSDSVLQGVPRDRPARDRSYSLSMSNAALGLGAGEQGAETRSGGEAQAEGEAERFCAWACGQAREARQYYTDLARPACANISREYSERTDAGTGGDDGSSSFGAGLCSMTCRPMPGNRRDS